MSCQAPWASRRYRTNFCSSLERSYQPIVTASGIAWIEYRPGKRGPLGSLKTPTPIGAMTPPTTDAVAGVVTGAVERAGAGALTRAVAGGAAATDAGSSPRTDAAPTTIAAAHARAPGREGRFM